MWATNSYGNRFLLFISQEVELLLQQNTVFEQISFKQTNLQRKGHSIFKMPLNMGLMVIIMIIIMIVIMIIIKVIIMIMIMIIVLIIIIIMIIIVII